MSPLDRWVLAISIPAKTQVTGRVVGICHLLRDTPYFPALRALQYSAIADASLESGLMAFAAARRCAAIKTGVGTAAGGGLNFSLLPSAALEHTFEPFQF